MKIRAQVYPIMKGELAFGFSIGFPKRHCTFDFYKG